MKPELHHGEGIQPSYPDWKSLSKGTLAVLLSSTLMACSEQGKSIHTPGVPLPPSGDSNTIPKQVDGDMGHQREDLMKKGLEDLSPRVGHDQTRTLGMLIEIPREPKQNKGHTSRYSPQGE